MLIHSIPSTSIHMVSFQFAVSTMSDQSDDQNMSEEQVNMSEGTSPSSSSDEGSMSTPSNLPKAGTKTRKKKTFDTDDEDFVADEATSKKKVLRKEYGTTEATKPGQKRKIPAMRIPMSKTRASTQETMVFTLESSDDEPGGTKKRPRKTTARVIGKPSEG